MRVKMKRSVKYPKIDSWSYTSSRSNVRKRINRNRHKSIRKIEKLKMKDI